MQTFSLILTLILGDPESGPAHDFIIDSGLTAEDCERVLMDNRAIWLGNDNIGMHCEVGQ